MMRRTIAVLIWLHACLAGVHACDLKQINSKWDLWNGAVCLRGANVWQRRIRPGDDLNAIGPGPLGPPYSAKSFERLAQWGANLVNISHPGIFSETRPFGPSEEAEANLVSLVEKTSAANLFSVIGFRTGPGRTEKAFTDEGGKKDHLVWRSAPAQNAWVSMWRHTARKFRNHPAVVGYELMVEPNSNGALLNVYDPEVFFERYGDTLYNWYPLAARIVRAIREEDPFTPILVGGMNWSSVNWLASIPMIDDPRVVYVAHQYEPFVFTHQKGELTRTYPGVFDGDYDGVTDKVDQDFLRTLLKPARDFKLTRGAPVTINEFGLIRYEPGAAQFLKDHFEIFESWDLSHAIWLWEADFEGIDWHDFNFRFGSSPNAVSEDPGSKLESVIREAWSKNRVRLSDIRGKW